MPRQEKITQEKTKFKGYFDTGRFYDLLFDLLVSLDYDVDEESYRQKDAPSGELELHWKGEKRVDKYTMFIIEAFVLVVLWKRKQNVPRGGVTLTLDFGDFETIISATLVRDYEGKWENNPLLNPFIDFYDRYIYREKYIEWQERAKDEVRYVIDEVKKFFAVQYPSVRPART